MKKSYTLTDKKTGKKYLLTPKRFNLERKNNWFRLNRPKFTRQRDSKGRFV